MTVTCPKCLQKFDIGKDLPGGHYVCPCGRVMHFTEVEPHCHPGVYHPDDPHDLCGDHELRRLEHLGYVDNPFPQVIKW